MDQDQLEKLRSRIDDVPHNADGRRRYTAPLKRDLIAYARARQAEGWIQRRIAEALGVSKATVCCWIGKRGKRSAAAKTKVARIKPVAVTLPVRRSSSPSLVLASGHRVEGLSVAELITLVKAL